MLLFEFIFLERKWERDQHRISKYLRRCLEDGYPTWLLLFPEVCRIPIRLR
jgi:1-acyl-sn-glycerol-3-phosphate acyltransferase